MMAGNPSWWGMFPPSLFPPQFSLSPSSSAVLPLNDTSAQPHSWSQLLLGDETQLLNPSPAASFADIVKQEVSGETNSLFGQPASAAWSQMIQVSSPASSSVSSLTTQNNSFLNFSYDKTLDQKNNQGLENFSECNSSVDGGACKKARVQPPPPLKVRKEKLVDRITALHQIVSPFGKTDTASVLSEAIGYIRFLQGQIEALSSPYLGISSKHIKNPQSVVQGGERSSCFAGEFGQLLNGSCLKKKATLYQNQLQEKPLKDLKSRGLCLVPVSCTQLVGGDNNGADYWAPAYGTGF